MHENNDKCDRITFVASQQEKVDLRLMCMLTRRTMSSFIRIAIKDKIKELKKHDPKTCEGLGANEKDGQLE